MCGTFRHYLVWSLAIVHSVLWTGAAIWHQATCSHNLPIAGSDIPADPSAGDRSPYDRSPYDRSPYDRTADDRVSTAGSTAPDCGPAAFSLCACSHGSLYSGQPHQPAHPQPHDSSHCLICQWLAQSHTPVAVVSIQTSPPFVQAAYSVERATVIAVPLFDCQIRGPPAPLPTS